MSAWDMCYALRMVCVDGAYTLAHGVGLCVECYTGPSNFEHAYIPTDIYIYIYIYIYIFI